MNTIELIKETEAEVGASHENAAKNIAELCSMIHTLREEVERLTSANLNLRERVIGFGRHTREEVAKMNPSPTLECVAPPPRFRSDKPGMY